MILIVVAFIVVFSYVLLEFLRKRNARPRWIPTKYLKRKWEAWTPRDLIAKGMYSSQLQEQPQGPTLHGRTGDRSAGPSTPNLADPERAHVDHETGVGAGATVDRHTSVRSVMTLPAYSRAARDNEQTLGREGDRDGIDVVLEQPETAEEEEDRREEAMASLYNIRMQRRQEIANREARRQERREARIRGDAATLERLRQESALRAQERELTSATAMMAEHRTRARDHRVSSVSYAELGVARHDGTRLRANSNESDRPLLDSAASIAGGSIYPASARNRSTSSVVSVSDNESDLGAPPFGRPAGDLPNPNMDDQTPASNRSRASSAAPSGLTPIDTGANAEGTAIPPMEPPSYDGNEYEDAPPYSSPVRTSAPQQVSQEPVAATPQRAEPSEETSSSSGAPMLPELGRLSSIHIAAATPVSPTRAVRWPSPER